MTSRIAPTERSSTSMNAAAGRNSSNSRLRSGRESPPQPPSAGCRAVIRSGNCSTGRARRTAASWPAKASSRNSKTSTSPGLHRVASRRPPGEWTVATTSGPPKTDAGNCLAPRVWLLGRFKRVFTDSWIVFGVVWDLNSQFDFRASLSSASQYPKNTPLGRRCPKGVEKERNCLRVRTKL